MTNFKKPIDEDGIQDKIDSGVKRVKADDYEVEFRPLDEMLQIEGRKSKKRKKLVRFVMRVNFPP